jgi:hypothetical protein
MGGRVGARPAGGFHFTGCRVTWRNPVVWAPHGNRHVRLHIPPQGAATQHPPKPPYAFGLAGASSDRDRQLGTQHRIHSVSYTA